jgi:hypothetical protein
MAQYKKISDYANQRLKYPYPSDKIDPTLKREKDWYLSVGEALISDYASNACTVPYDFGEKRTFAELKLYATGRQSNAKLKKSILGAPKTNPKTGRVGHVTKMNVSWETYMKLPQMFDVMRSKNMPQEYDVSLYCIDPDSLAAREKTKSMLKFIIDENTQKFMEKTRYKPDVQPDPAELGLMSSLDIDMYFESGGYTLEWERAAKAACLKTKQVSDYKVLQDATFDDLIVNPDAITGWKTYIEESTQLVKIRKVDMEKAVVPFFVGNEFNGMRAGEIRAMTIADIRKENPSMTAADLMHIAKCFEWMNPGYTSLLNGHYYDNSYLSGYNQGFDLDPISRVKVLVLDYQWLSTDIETNLTNVNEKTGWKMFKEVPFSYQPDEKSKKKGDKLVKKNVIRKYYANWIIGTDHMVSYGCCKDVVYYGEDGNKTPRLDYFFVKTGNASLVERAIAIVDDIDLIMFKHRNAWATLPAAPAMAIQKDLLENVFLNGELQQPEDIVQGFIERGILYYNGLDDNGKPLYFAGGQKPIDYMDVSKMAGMLSICSSEIALKVNELREVLGLQNGADGGQTSPYQGLGQSQLAQQNANASLVPTFNAYNYLFRSAFTDVVKKWQIVAKNKKGIKIPYSVLGNHNMKVLELSDSFTNAEYNVDFRIGATLEEKQSMLAMLAEQKALGQQTEGSMGLTTSEWLYLYDRVMSGSTEEAMFIMAKIEKKKQQERKAAKQSDIQDNAKVQQDSAAMKGQIDQALLQQKGQQEISNTMISELLKQNRELLNLMLAPKKEGEIQSNTSTAEGIIAMNNATVQSIAQPQPEPQEAQMQQEQPMME